MRTRTINEFLRTRYSVAEVRALPQAERETFLMLANAHAESVIQSQPETYDFDGEYNVKD